MVFNEPDCNSMSFASLCKNDTVKDSFFLSGNCGTFGFPLKN